MSSLKVGCIQKLNHLRYPSKTIRECVITQNASPFWSDIFINTKDVNKAVMLLHRIKP